MPETTTSPIIEVKKDYDGYFERLVKGWVAKKKGDFKHKKIVISSGPWRSDAISYQSDGETIVLDFYAALRNGFGWLSAKEQEEIIELL